MLVEKINNKPTAWLLALDYKTLAGLPVKYAGFGVTRKAHEYSFPEIYNLVSDLQFAPRVGEGIIGPCTGFDNEGPVMCVSARCANRKEAGRAADSGCPLYTSRRPYHRGGQERELFYHIFYSCKHLFGVDSSSDAFKLIISMINILADFNHGDWKTKRNNWVTGASFVSSQVTDSLSLQVLQQA